MRNATPAVGGAEASKTWPLLASQTARVARADCDSTPQIYIWKQHLAALLANFLSMTTGIALAWSAPAVPVLRGQVPDPQPLRLSLEQGSWVSAIMPLTSLAGALVAGPLAERVGRKGALLAIAVPMMLGWLLMAFAGPSIWLLLAGRILTGAASGAVSGPAALYCEEIADVRVRGALGTYQYLMNCIGFAWICGLGALLPYFWFTASALLPTLLFVLTFSWMPESPAYLAVRHRHQEAHRALAWLRGPGVDLNAALETLLASRAQTAPTENAPEQSFFSVCSRQPWRSTTLRSLLILLTLMFFQQITGISLLVFYTVQVFQEAHGSISSHLSSFIVACGNTSAAITSNFLVDRAGRRILLLLSCLAMGICLAILSIYAQLDKNNYNMDGWKWIPLASLIVYGFMFSIGLGPMPWFQMAELTPMHAKSWVAPAVICMNRLVMFLVAKQSPLMLENVGQVPTYAMFSSFCFLAVVFVILWVPETKGKTKAEILRKIGGDQT